MLLAPEDRTALQSLPLRGIVSSPGITARGGIVPSWSGEAVVNRSHNGELSLVGSEQAERHVFASMLEVTDPDAGPEEYQQLLQNMTIKQLTAKLDRLFHSFAVQTWKPVAARLLEPLLKEGNESCTDIYE